MDHMGSEWKDDVRQHMDVLEDVLAHPRQQEDALHQLGRVCDTLSCEHIKELLKAKGEFSLGPKQ